MSDLMTTVKILAGSTAEIAAASVGDQHLVATVRFAEEKNSVETLNGLEVVEVSAEVIEKAEENNSVETLNVLEVVEVSAEVIEKAEENNSVETLNGLEVVEVSAEVPEKAGENNSVENLNVLEVVEVSAEVIEKAEENNSVENLNGLEIVEVSSEMSEEAEEAVIGKTGGGELEELPSALPAVEETTVEVKDDHFKSEADSPAVANVYVESSASSEEASVTEKESILELEETMSPAVMLSEDETISGPSEAMSEMVKAVDQNIEEDTEQKQETETEHSDFTALPTDLEETLRVTTDAAEEVVAEIMLDVVEEAKPFKAPEEAIESGNVTMIMAQA